MKADRSSIEREWYLNLAFYFGNQNVVSRGRQGRAYSSAPGAGTLYTPDAPYYRSRPVINRIRPVIRTELSKLTSQKPNAFIIPASSEDRDLYAAQAGEQIWESVYRGKKIDNVLRRAVFWALTCGTGFIKAYWDPVLIDPINQQQGDFCFEPETPWHIYVPNLREEDLERQPYIIHAMKKSKDFARMYFPGVNYTSAENSDNTVVEDEFLNMMSGASTKDQTDVLILEVWVKPGAVPQFPNGAMFTIVGDTLVQGTDGWPYEHYCYPFAKIDHIPTGKFYGVSSITDLIPLQREYNRTRGQIIEAKNRMAKPMLMAERGAIDPSQITSEPGQVVLYESGFAPPTALPLQSVPPYVIDELNRILQDMADISGIHEVSQGQVPPGVTAATAIAYLQEQDETKLSLTVHNIERGMEKVAQLTLQYAHQFWDAERSLKVIGKDGSFDYLAFKGSDLRGNTDIEIEGGSALPTSRAAKQAFIMDMMDKGYIPPEEGLGMMDMGGINRLNERLMIDKKQAQRENLKMSEVTEEMLNMHLMNEQQKAMQNGMFPDPATGLPMDPVTGEITPPALAIPVNTWDNHAVHVEEHNNYRKGQAFENLSEESKALFDQHVEQHLDMIMGLNQGLMGGGMGDPMMGGGMPPMPPDDMGMEEEQGFPPPDDIESDPNEEDK